MTNFDRRAALELIQANIDKRGNHIYLVAASEAVPRFAYTVGLNDQAGGELVLAGAVIYSAKEIEHIINQVAHRFREASIDTTSQFQIESLGTFSLRAVDSSWVKSLLLGAIDFYGRESIAALQIVPDREHWTIDTPDLSQPWDASSAPVWQWLRAPWTFPVSVESTATTNLAALRGAQITEAARWEDDRWELFAGAGPDVPEEELRVVPLGTLLAADPSLVAVTQLEVGRALWREVNDAQWHQWG